MTRSPVRSERPRFVCESATLADLRIAFIRSRSPFALPWLLADLVLRDLPLTTGRLPNRG